jgi:hypothetical protein
MIYSRLNCVSYDAVDRIILDKVHTVCDRVLVVQKAQIRDVSQRSYRIRSRSNSMLMFRVNYNRYCKDNLSNHVDDMFESMSNGKFNFNTSHHFNEGNNNN